MSELEPTIDVATTPLSGASLLQPDQRPDPTVVPAAEVTLLDSLAAAVLATHGVLRLEPSLQSSLRRFMTATKQQLPIPNRPSVNVAGAGGITVIHRTGPAGLMETQVSVDIATSPLAPAREIARAVRRAIIDCVQLHRHHAGLIHVNVLSIEPSPTHPSST
jgi:hypothetical protein